MDIENHSQVRVRHLGDKGERYTKLKFTSIQWKEWFDDEFQQHLFHQPNSIQAKGESMRHRVRSRKNRALKQGQKNSCAMT